MQETILILIFVFVFIGIIHIKNSMNRNRIRDHILSRGGIIKSIKWEPFGPGWFGEKNNMIYHVCYIDKLGAHHDAYCKTSLWSGVYFTKDFVTQNSPIVKRMEANLKAENRRLREELEVLKNKNNKNNTNSNGAD